MATFKAIVIEKAEGGTKAALTDFDEANLMDGDVTVRVEYSTLNYKDALAITGKAPVVRRFPMIAGIDFAGTVEASSTAAWKPGDKVILNGWGCGETHLGAYGGKARVKGDWLVRLPDGMSTRDAMAIGTAGFTAMLAVLALEKQGLSPKSGPMVVTGAAGGVGSVAIALLAKRGFKVIASTGRLQEEPYLRSLAVVVFITLPISTTSAIVFGASMGLLWLSTVPPTSALVALMFGTRWMATLFGFAFFSHQVGGFLGVWLGGVLFTTTGSYNVVWWLSVVLGVVSAIINLPIIEKPVERMAAVLA